MTLVSLEAAAAQQGGPQPASRKRPAPQEQPERESRRPRRASRPDGAQCSADGAQAAEAQPPAAAAAPAATRSVDPVVVAERAAMAAAKQAEAERRRGELLEAYQVFQEQETQRLMFMEVDAGKLSPRRLEGRTVRIYWPDDDAWYLGQVKAYCKDSGKHKVHYADGERQEEVLALERVRLLVHAGEELPFASGASMSATMALLRRLLHTGGCEPARKRLLQQRLTELTAYAKQRYGEQLQAEERERSATVASRSCLGPAATAHITARSAEGSKGSGGERGSGGSGGERGSGGSGGERGGSGGERGNGGSGGERGSSGGVAIQRALALAAQLPDSIKINSGKPPNANHRAWALNIIIQKKTAWLGGLTREQTAVCSDLLTVWRQNKGDAGCTNGKPLPVLLFPAAGYAQDAALMQQLRQPSSALEMKAVLQRLLLPGQSNGQAQQAQAQQQQAQGQQQPQHCQGQWQGQQHQAAEQGQQQQAGEQQQREASVEPLVAADFAGEDEQVADYEPSPQAVQQGAAQADEEDELPSAAAAAAAPAEPAPADGSLPAAASEGAQEGAAAAGTAAAGGEPVPPRPLRVGEVGWFQVRGYPHWPFLVITQEEAVARGLPAAQLKNPAYVPVQYFGTAEVSGVNPLAVEKGASKKRAGGGARCMGTFLEGLEHGWHAPQHCKKGSQFRVALSELETYFKEGNLPPSMVSKNNTDGEADEEEQQEAEPEPAAKPAAKKRKSQAKAGGAADAEGSSGPLGLPMQLNKTLTVVALGDVEWLHPAFHNEKAIFPPGYRAERLARTPASGGKEVMHVMEVCRAPNGSGPLFRVTPQGFPSVEGPTATKAWQALYASDAAGAARSLNLSGELMFGLSHARVQSAIRALPGAQRCERYCGWPEGQQPEPVPLSAREQRERLACEARMQHLPEGVEAQPGPQRPPGICHVCDEEDETDVNLVMQCANCHLFVHMNCYGVAEPPNGKLWLCDVCALGLSAPPPCVLCPVAGGALRRTSCGRWAHVVCCDYVPETHLDPDRGVIQGVPQVHRSRFQLTCHVCKQRHGACTQCCEPKCYVGFHPLCARRAGLRMERVEDSDCEDEEDGEEEEVQAAQQPSAGQAAFQPAGGEASCDENDASAPNGNSKRPGGRGRASSGGKGRHTKQQEGVALDDGSRLLAFCPKHSQGASTAAGTLPLGQLQQQSSGAAAAAAAEAARASLPPLCGDTQQAAVQQQHAQHDAGPPPAPMANPWGSARAAPFNPAARRGSRAPEAAAAAEAKRGYVLSQPYLVGGPRRHELVHSSGREQWRPLEVPPSGRRVLPADAVVVQVHTLSLPGQEAAEEGAVAAAAPAQRRQQAERQQQGAAPPPPGAQQQQQVGSGGMSTPRPAPLHAARRAASGLGSPQAGVPHLAASPRASCKSDAERYREMRDTLGHRVTIGKSGIHGWGAFAKTRHAAYTMVIEYVGELVRDSVVTEVREKRWYNDMVGAGTYVFRLGGDSNMCVDATRAGNLAHMLNHSCANNCYSRTTRFVEDGREVDRVIIYASRDIEPGEELTYDYRFGGDEQLPCNCGAPGCRGRVNEKPPNAGEIWAPRSQLRPYKPPKSGLDPAAKAAAAAVAQPAAAVQLPITAAAAAAQQPQAGEVQQPVEPQQPPPAVQEQEEQAQAVAGATAAEQQQPGPVAAMQGLLEEQQQQQQVQQAQQVQLAAAEQEHALFMQQLGQTEQAFPAVHLQQQGMAVQQQPQLVPHPHQHQQQQHYGTLATLPVAAAGQQAPPSLLLWPQTS